MKPFYLTFLHVLAFSISCTFDWSKNYEVMSLKNITILSGYSIIITIINGFYYF